MSFLLYAPPKPDCEGVPRAFRGCEQGPREQAPKDVQAAPVVGWGGGLQRPPAQQRCHTSWTERTPVSGHLVRDAQRSWKQQVNDPRL
jgi:hypothetical protein